MRGSRMNTRRALLALGMAMTIVPAHPAAADRVSRLVLRSPNGRVEVVLALDDGGRPTYCVSFDGRPLIVPSPLGLRLTGSGALSQGLSIASVTESTVDRHYTLLAGKTRTARDHCNQLSVDLEEVWSGRHRRRLRLTFRAYDDGVAFRYRIHPRHGREVIRIEDELTRFDFPDDYGCWALNLGTFTTGHEGEFRHLRASAIGEADLLDVPLVCRTGAAVFAIAEADLKDYAGLYLRGHGEAAGVQARLSPRLDDPTVAVRGRPGSDLQSPWRVLMIADHPGELIGSTLITSLNPAPRVKDTEWIKPGKYAWNWWSGALGVTDAAIRHFIDFAAEAGLQYMLIDAGWYVSAPGDEGGPTADITRSLPDLHLPALVEYAGRRSIGLLVWLHWQALDRQMDRALALYRRLGIKGIKVDFMDRNDQDMVAFYHRLLATALRHRLLVDLHGAYPPTGLQRTYPNLLTQEAVMGAEYNKWSARVTATHNVTLPFTRMVLGPMDYTPGGFRNVTPHDFVARDTLPLVQTTRGHALAMYVVYDSPLVSLADAPDAYKDQAGMDFLSAVPATWDETRFIAGDIGRFIVTARRNGSDWFVGAMTNEAERTVQVPLDFLGNDQFSATIYADGDTPTAIAISQRAVGPRDTIELRLASGGGGTIAIVPAPFVD
jgi:alpha-glucosidase